MGTHFSGNHRWCRDWIHALYRNVFHADETKINKSSRFVFSVSCRCHFSCDTFYVYPISLEEQYIENLSPLSFAF